MNETEQLKFKAIKRNKYLSQQLAIKATYQFQLGKTFYSRRNEVIHMWRFSKSNGTTERFYRKIVDSTSRVLF